MGKFFKDFVKNTAVMFAVGAALGLVAPLLADLVGLAPGSVGHSADPLWMGAFFGAFGALHSVLMPIASRIFGEEKPMENMLSPSLQQERAREPEIIVHPVRDPKFRETLLAERNAGQHQHRDM